MFPQGNLPGQDFVWTAQGIERMRLNATGLGIGMAPNSWSTLSQLLLSGNPAGISLYNPSAGNMNIVFSETVGGAENYMQVNNSDHTWVSNIANAAGFFYWNVGGVERLRITNNALNLATGTNLQVNAGMTCLGQISYGTATGGNISATTATFSGLVTLSAGVSSVGDKGVMTRIGQVVCSGSQATVVFSSIPGTYTSLKVVVSGRDTAAGSGDLKFRLFMNADTTAANYTKTQIVDGVGSAASAVANASTTAGCQVGEMPGVSGLSTAVGATDIIIPNYAQTTFFKAVISTSFGMFTVTPTVATYVLGFVWLSTAAITTLTFTAGGTAFVNGSTFTLYGMP